MKKIATLFLAVVLLFTVSACGNKDAFQKVKTFLDSKAIVEGEWKVANLTEAENSIKAYYKEGENSIFLEITEEDLTLTICLTEGDDSFSWQGESDNYTMFGLAKKKDIYTHTHALPYEETNVPSYLRTLFNETCTSVLQDLFTYADENFEEIDVSMANLGFSNLR